MLKEQAKFFATTGAAVDLAVLAAAFALVLRALGTGATLLGDGHYLWVLLQFVLAWGLFAGRLDLYASMRMKPVRQVLGSLAKVHLMAGAAVWLSISLVTPGFPRHLFAAFLLLALGLLSAEKVLLLQALRFFRKRGYNTRNILIVGSGEKAVRFYRLLEEHGNWGLRLAGFLAVEGEESSEGLPSGKILGARRHLVEVCSRVAVDEVVLCQQHGSPGEIEEMVREMEVMGITVRMIIDICPTDRSCRDLAFFHGEFPMLSFYSRMADTGQLFVKRCIDVGGGLLGVAVTLLLCPFIAAAIKIDSPGPLLFGQERVGRRGRRFRCWKFRSMHRDAEERKQGLSHLNEMSGPLFKMRNDPRVTRVGRFLRRTSLDELPQFWNVLKGDMSLVGTRPPTPDEVAIYETWHRKRICIKPGITGLWQVSGRNRISDFDDVVRLDLQYIDCWTLWLDIKILLKTVWIVFLRQGSY